MGELLDAVLHQCSLTIINIIFQLLKNFVVKIVGNCVNFNITSDMVKTKLGKLKMKMARGIDQIGTRMLIEIAEEISNTVTELYINLRSGDIPQDWKLANITPVFKKGKKTDPSNYRPVGLTAILCKVFESVMREKMLDHIERYELIKETTWFVKKKSCLINFLTFFGGINKISRLRLPI